MSRPMAGDGNYARIYAVVRRIPKGRVATYGQVAELAGLARHARQVGYALAELDDQRTPWHRVINAQGRVSGRAVPRWSDRQRVLLEAEGVEFGASGRVSLAKYRWKPRSRSAAATPRGR